MGLDLMISKKSNAKINKKGQSYWTITELCSLRNCWSFIEELDLENCKDEAFTAKQLWIAAEAIEKVDERNYVMKELLTAKIKKNYNKLYIVHAWW